MRGASRVSMVMACVLLTGCSLRQSDERALRREFAIPGAARAITYQASPSESGWFGREGLRITMVFALSRADFDRYARTAESSGLWQPLPIPKETRARLALPSLPSLPQTGLYQIRTAGTDILRAPKRIRPTLKEDVNDFMLALIDPGTRTIAIRVSTNY